VTFTPEPPRHVKLFSRELLSSQQWRRLFLTTEYIIVLVTTANKQEAEKIAQHLLNDRLIACANIIGPVASFFHWSGKDERAEEYLVLMKSRLDLFDRLTEAVKITHSYEVPEILALPIVAGSRTYLDWLSSCLV
jgi:periplasmic divalent cation tolerance protein